MTNNTPDRIWACMNGPMVGLFISGGGNAGWPEYVRADIHAAALARVAELEAAMSKIMQSVTPSANATVTRMYGIAFAALKVTP